MTRWSLDPVGGWLLIAVAALALAPLLAVGPDRQKASRGRRLTLVALRAATLLLLLVAMLRPAVETAVKRKLPGTLAILADRSRSMQVEDAVAGASRWNSVRESLADVQDQLVELADTWDVKIYTFADAVEPSPLDEGQLDLPAEPEGNQTAMGSALSDVLDQEAQQRLVAVLLLSDGAQRAFAPRDQPPQIPAGRMAAAGVPLYTFAYGQPSLGDQADLRLGDMLVSDAVFVDTPVTVEAVVSASGYANQTFKVQLLWENSQGEMEPAATTEIEVRPQQRRFPIKLTHVPTEPGEYKVTMQVEAAEGELVTKNNSQSTFVTVLKGGVSILYLVGSDTIGASAAGIEPRFLRAALAASPDFDVQYELINYRNPELDYRPRLRDEKYDVYLLGNVDVTALSTRSWREMANQVNQGAGLAMLGGFHSFGPGGFRNSPLDDVLPFDIGPAERQAFGEPPREDMHVKGPLRMIPVERGGAVHPILRLPGEETMDIWRKLPELDGANRFEWARLKDQTALVAATDDRDGLPLLVLSGWGGGRVASLAVDSTWHWQMGGAGEVHRRFWRQLILWLAKKDETEGLRVWVKLDQRRYQPGSRVDFTLGATGEDQAPIEGAEFTVNVVKPDGTGEEVRVIRRGGEWGGSFATTAEPGDYRIEVAAADAEGVAIGEAAARFAVIDQDVELDQPAAEPTLLASLANLTADAGGAGLAPEELPALIESLQAKSQEFEEEIVNRVTLWDTWWMFLALVGGLSTEWFLRKRWGLV
ncbi:MAG: hypothetical protein CMJ58_26710 [Planctomycetaceae bacterium]|nr:hypothetical protein [Planctomycetaceae bacterium]